MPLTRRLRFEHLEAREVPANVPLLAFGADAGVAPRVHVVERETGAVRFDVVAFGAAFRGGVRVAVGDVTGDGQDDVIAASGPGMAPVVKVFDGLTGALVKRFVPVTATAAPARAGVVLNTSAATGGSTAGVTVAAGDVDGDGRAEVIVAADMIGVYDGRTGRRLQAFASGLPAGVRVAAGDTDGDGKAEVVVGAAGGPQVRVLDGRTGRPEAAFRGLPGTQPNGVYVAVADTDADGLAEVVVGSGAGTAVSIHDGRTGAGRTSFAAPAAGARVAGALVDAGGRSDVLVGSAKDGAWAAYDGSGAGLTTGAVADFKTGVWVAASPERAAVNRQSAQGVLDWNAAALAAIRVEKTPPPKAARALAILQVAVYDAVRGIVKSGKAYQVTASAPAGASLPAAVARAAHTALAGLFPAQAAALDARLAAALAAVPDGPAKVAGDAWGRAVAAAVLAARAADGAAAAATPPYTPGTGPGDWQPTPPANAAVLLPGWGAVTPFGIGYAAGLVPAGPPDLASPEWAADFNEVKRLGSKTSTERTADQTEIALFWADGGGTFTPAGHWNAIAAQLARADGLSVLDTARLFAHLNVAEADAAIVCWKTKFTYEFWRPVTAVRAGDTDGNPDTAADPTWEPLIATPPFPDYTSGHSTFSGAAAAVLEHYFGADRGFATQSDNGSITRSFAGFAQAAEEAGKSRIYGGIHYQTANRDALACGREVADRILRNVL